MHFVHRENIERRSDAQRGAVKNKKRYPFPEAQERQCNADQGKKVCDTPEMRYEEIGIAKIIVQKVRDVKNAPGEKSDGPAETLSR